MTTARWFGIDVSKRTFDAALSEGAHREFPRTRSGAGQFARWARHLAPEAPDLAAVMEATGSYSSELACWISEADPALAVSIINPQFSHAFARSLGLRNKTDKVDASMLARYGMERRPPRYCPPSPLHQQIRELQHQREAFVQSLVAEKNRRGEMPEAASSLASRLRQEHIAHLERATAEIDRELKRLIESEPELKADAELLDAIPGVGLQTITVVLTEIGDLRRFPRRRALSAFAGLSPRQHQSGSSVPGKTRLCKKGSPRVRKVLYTAAMSAVRGKNDFALHYRRLVEAGHARKSALAAIMRKLLLTMRAVLVTRKPYQNPQAAALT